MFSARASGEVLFDNQVERGGAVLGPCGDGAVQAWLIASFLALLVLDSRVCFMLMIFFI